MAQDKNTIGVTPENRQFLADVVESGLFNEEMDAAKLAMSVAILRGIEIGEATSAETKWNVGSFDKDGHIKIVLVALFPEHPTPYRLSEYLINRGLQILKSEMAANPSFDIATLQKSSVAPDGTSN